jgi:hypothetical protein
MAVYWIPNLLVALNAPRTLDNKDFLMSWWAWEGGNGGPNRNVYPSAKYNWLNSTTKVLGSTTFNDVGVQNYPTYLSGIYGTHKTITNYKGHPSYYNLVHALKAGNPMSTSWRKGVNAGLSTWVSGTPDSEEGLAYAKRVIDLALVYKAKRSV